MPGRKYRMRLLVWGQWSGQCVAMMDGPAGQAQATDLLKGHDVDDAGNAYWVESNEPVIRSYRAVAKRAVTLAGSVPGVMDGPCERARFGGWSYNKTSLICVSGNGKHLFVKDSFGGELWRYVDLEAGNVQTLRPIYLRDKGNLIIAKDPSGEIYAFTTSGAEPPDCKGYRKLKTPALDGVNSWIPFDGYALDARKMAFYWHCRGDVMSCDLKTGTVANLTPGSKRDRWGSSGSFEGWTPYCPTGMSISPTGRYLHVGGGDYPSFWQFDLETRRILGFGWNAEGKDLMFRETGAKPNGNANFKGHHGSPADAVFFPDGRSAIWTSIYGVFLVEPAE